MRMSLLLLFVATSVVGAPAQAQKVPKIDSLLIRLPQPKAAAMDAVLEAFVRAGLSVTDNSGSMVEADLGGKKGLTGMKFSRVVRALAFGKDSVTTIMISGEEVREDEHGKIFKRLRIDNKAGGNGEKIWRKMVEVAVALDSMQVPTAAFKKKK